MDIGDLQRLWNEELAEKAHSRSGLTFYHGLPGFNAWDIEFSTDPQVAFPGEMKAGL